MCLISFSNFNQFLGKQLRNFSNVAMTLFTGFPEAFGVQYGLTLQNVCRKKKDVLLSEVINNIISTMVEELLKEFENVCTLRVRMPISSDLSNPRNFITKITCYNKVVNIPNRMTVLDELLPNSIEKEKRNCRGIWNFTNPGVVSHNEILEMCRDYIDPDFKCINFNLEEQAKVIVAPRSNNELDTFKLKGEFPEMLSIKDSLLKYVFEPNKKNRLANGA